MEQSLERLFGWSNDTDGHTNSLGRVDLHYGVRSQVEKEYCRGHYCSHRCGIGFIRYLGDPMTDLKLVQNWNADKLSARMADINIELKKRTSEASSDDILIDYPEDLGKLLDESVIIMLEILNIVGKEKGWKGQSSLEMFEPVYAHASVKQSITYKWILQRFRETYTLVMRYKESSKSERARMSAKMISRGML